jgi:hypothetical protein
MFIPSTPAPRLVFSIAEYLVAVLSAIWSDLECSANYLILRVTLASAMSPGKIALGSFFVLVWRRLGHFETISLPDGKKIIISLD